MFFVKMVTMQIMTKALILFAHGSRNLAWRTPFEHIAKKVAAQTRARVELAFLELMSPTLPEVFRQLAIEGVTEITVVPLFFGLGNHVTQDLQRLVNAFVSEFADVAVNIAAPLGESDAVLSAMADYAIQVQPR
jgi:sirohydrochlorin cobaltochelatase